MCHPGESAQGARARAAIVVCLLAVVGAAGCGSGGSVARPQEATVSQEETVDQEGTAVPTPDQPDVTAGSTAVDPAPAVLTQDDDGSAVSLAAGGEVALRLDSAWSWGEPALDGDAVVLTPVDYFDDPGFVEWLVTGTSPGRTTLRAEGAPACGDPEACPPRELTIEVVVTG